ncbi:hypothetical protein QKT49_gp453 [Acanthamoeba castellanii medusavirus]|uniref:Uncharacterized protein n=1 Tax=Acanthamoeba castellanii medusavirus J1 TaxID=3114988 RepID=A0A3T1CWU7_9VIRU|nr:hypothetical protein QKT49_gp453 [Acanthamoeba castellanii medusavirus]BBI30310.1 hypothetical protein [Acanthamoeba castellanii medusavirus J1]
MKKLMQPSLESLDLFSRGILIYKNAGDGDGDGAQKALGVACAAAGITPVCGIGDVASLRSRMTFLELDLERRGQVVVVKIRIHLGTGRCSSFPRFAQAITPTPIFSDLLLTPSGW